MVRFKLAAFPEMPLKGLVTHISVEPAQQRTGLGTAVCLALAATFPGRVWDVECPNDASSALFTQLHLAQPDLFVEQGLVHPF
ncbi:hypothetical protein [Cryobacterium sp. Hb1]|uniref:hypothetical protein n=1 Tax=Cryobacterium sp. Hb1 TaxID=1259147 RepID=UPI001069FAA8|nr:hypothetical protein [Cryobacterium sp. Hb1]TFD72133.1 hypothetical protein E3T38_01160 [Cryobacterium sp. Hb1]